jgi:predicted permease
MSLRTITHGLRRLLNPQAADRALDDEIHQYIIAAADEYVKSGMSRAEAERRARMDFGGVEAAKEAVRDAGWESIPDRVRRDVSFAVRTFGRNPGFTASVLVTLALGIGAATAMFSVLQAVLLRPLPYHEPDKLALIWTDDVRRGLHQEPTAYSTIQDWRRDASAFQGIAYFSVGRSAINDNGRRATARYSYTSGNTFAVLGVQPALGRTLTVEDERERLPVAVISHSLWQQQFHGDSAVIGRPLVLDGGEKGGASLRIVGVMPPTFYFPYRQTDIWIPATQYWRFSTESSERFPDWARRWTAVGRVRDGASIDDARDELERLGARLSTVHQTTIPDFPGFSTTVMPILDSVANRNLRTALWVLMGGVVLVLLVACANVANLLLARGAARHHELIVRQAIGASRGRLVGQLMVESLLLALIGGAAGLTLAWSTVRAIVAAGAGQVPRLNEASMSMPVLVFALCTAVAAGLIFGTVPAFGLTGTLNVGMRGSGTSRSRRMRQLLVVSECTIAIVLLAGAGLLLRSLGYLNAVDPGFDPSRTIAVRIEFPPDARTAGEESEKDRALRRHTVAAEVRRRVAALPGVEAAGYMDDLFIAGTGNESIAIPGRADLGMSPGELTEGSVSAGFFDALKVRLVLGRLLTDADVTAKINALWAPINNAGTLGERQARAVFEPVVVNTEFVRRFFPGENPIGKQFCVDPTNKTYWYTIVGVVSDMRRQGLAKQAIAQYFGPWLAMPMSRVDLLVRASGDPPQLSAPVRAAVQEVVPGAIVGGISTVESQLGAFHAQRSFQTVLLSIFAALAIALAAVGIFGVVHYTVSERAGELGIRIALGATPGRIRGLVIAQGMREPILGVVIGIALALAATRLLSAALFGVTATDPMTYAAVAGILLGVAAVACLIPAIRATRVDPITALRRE